MSIVFAAALAATTLVPSRLLCEGLIDPLGIDVHKPRLSWIVESSETGQRQTAYRILVASSRQRLESGSADLWDSGRVASNETLGIVYAGKPLKSAQQAFWNVRVWDRDGSESKPSKTCSWTMFMFSQDWKPKWIGAVDRTAARKGIGYHGLEAPSLDTTQWVQVDLGKTRKFDSVVLHPVRNHLGYAIFGFPVRFRVEASDDPAFKSRTVLLDQTRADFPMTGEPLQIRAAHSGRYVRVTATRLYRRKDGIGCFALAELQVMSGRQNAALGKVVEAQDSVERDGWTKAALTDGAGVDTEPVTLLLRKELSLSKPIRRALCFVSGLGQYEMWINGKRVGQDWLTPGWTQYQNSVLADSYDVTAMLQAGPNSLAMLLGNGMYNMESDSRGAQQQNSIGADKAACLLRIEYSDGSVGRFETDSSWSSHPGPETYSGVFGGEDWDARLEQRGWDKPGFRGAAWTPAKVVSPPTGALHGITYAAPPLRVIETRGVVAESRPSPDVLVLDLGQNAPYVPLIDVEGAAGSSIQMWPAEMLKSDGAIDQRTIRAGKRATYTLRGDGVESWHPRFWYCGSRYWQIVALDPAGKQIDPKSLLRRFNGLMVHSSARPVGSFSCSNESFNQIYNLIHWAIRSNLASVISDCPHREKSGWLEQIHLNGPGLMFTYDMTNLFRKTVADMQAAQQPKGMVPTMAPEYFFYEGGFRDSIEWGGTYLFMPKMMRDWYADLGVAGLHYDGMKRYVDYLGTRAKDHILSNGLGDWNGYGNDPRTPVAVTDTAYYYRAVSSLAGLAKDLGKSADAAHYGELADRIRVRFNEEFFAADSGKVSTGSQSCQATALDLGLIPADQRDKAFAQLLRDVEEHDYSVSCGEVGHPSLLRVLSENGHADLVAKIHLQREKPGYLYQIDKGMTTLAEAWDASPISLNHFMLGHIMEWFFADLVGINPDPAKPGFGGFIVRPRPVPQVSWAKASYDSVRGPISCSWKSAPDSFFVEVEVPANCTAKVYLPYEGQVTIDPSATGIQDGAVLLPSGRFRIVVARRSE